MTAEELMRSRYTAYALGRPDHLFRTWHPRTRPDDVEPLPDLRWTGLTVLAADGGPEDEVGVVEFEATYESAAGRGVLHERSQFVRHRGRWVYVGEDD